MTDLWFTRCPVPTATGVAAARGWFDDEFAADGVTVRSLQDGAGPALKREHFSHGLPTLIREGGNVPALWARSRGADTRLIGLTWIDERQALVTAPGGPDLDGDPRNLAGLRVAIPFRATEEIDFWRAMALAGFAGALRAAGLGGADRDPLAAVTPVDVVPELWSDGVGAEGFAPEVRAVLDGRADVAYVKGAPGLEAARRAGARIALELDAFADRSTRVNNGTPRPITVHAALLEEHPDLVARFVGVLLRAADWARDEPDALAEVLARETHAGGAAVAGAYRGDDHRRLHLDLSDERLALLAQQKDFLHAQGFLAADVDLDVWVDRTPLDTALTATGATRAL